MNRFPHRIMAAVVVSASLAFCACITTPVALAPSSTPIDPAKMGKNLGSVRGMHRTGSVFGVWMVGRPDINRAIDNALAQKPGAGALINVRCYSETWYFFFFSLDRVIIEGDAVELGKDKDQDKDPKKDAKKR